MVSEKLSDLALDHQVICVTHLPQIASMADVHYEISKSVTGGRTVTEVKELKHRLFCLQGCFPQERLLLKMSRFYQHM